MIYELFRYNNQNFPKYFSNCYEIVPKILRNNYRHFQNFLKLFKIILKISVIFLDISRNIFGSFQKFSEIIFEIIRNYLFLKILRNTRISEIILEIFLNNFWNFPDTFQNFSEHFSKFHEMNLKILRNNPRN